MTDRPEPKLTSRIMRGVSLTGLGLVGLAAVTGIVLWDADFYTLRDKYEHLIRAFTGDWQAENWCPPGRVSKTCSQVDAFEKALEDALNFTFFKSMPIGDTGLTVQTGIRFATAHDVVDGSPSEQWCYVSIPQGAVSQKIDLASKSANKPPVYEDLESLDASALAGSGLSLDVLQLVARSHCQFDE